MKGKSFKISGVGCALVDYLYKPINFKEEQFKRYMSVKPGDGGLSPGKLVFKDEFEMFAGDNYHNVRNVITNSNPPVALNIGGPSIVSLIHASQILTEYNAELFFYGCKGNDDEAIFMDENIRRTSLKIGKYKFSNQYTPFTDVFSDPYYDQGNGERIFINNIGAAWDLLPEDMDEAFFESDITVFGGTALVPRIHESLQELLQKAKEKKAITIVNTVYDNLSEKKAPNKAWPLGNSIDTYKYVDLLIADMEEALCLSGTDTLEEALQFFKNTGVGGVIVTHGANPLHYYCESSLLGSSKGYLPVSKKIKNTIIQYPDQIGDTTGCGDNFAGGIIASIAAQLIENSEKKMNIQKAMAMGVVSGGFACFYHGGTFYENYPGEKWEQMKPFYNDYLNQLKINP